MRKNYIQPSFEVMAVNTAECVCQQPVSVFGSFYNGGGTETIDPENGGL